MKTQIAALFVCSTACAQLAAPAPITVEDMHEKAVARFEGRPGFGASRMASVDGVSDSFPVSQQTITLLGEDFVVKEMQLIGIARHEPPVAFVIEDSSGNSPHRPSGKNAEAPLMGKVQDYLTRSLTDNEKQAIATMRLDGAQDLVVSGPSFDLKAEVVGAIRAKASCLECHAAKPGELLGAFSYTLVGVPSPRVSPGQFSLEKP